MRPVECLQASRRMRSRLLCEHFRGIVFVVFDGSVDEFSLVEVSHVFWVDFGFWVWFKGSVQGLLRCSSLCLLFFFFPSKVSYKQMTPFDLLFYYCRGFYGQLQPFICPDELEANRVQVTESISERASFFQACSFFLELIFLFKELFSDIFSVQYYV